MDKRLFNRWINRLLCPLFIGSLCSGVGLHISGHAGDPDAWHRWAMAHAVVSLLFVGGVAAHVRGHWGWYRALKTAGCKGRRRRMVLGLTTLFLVAGATGIAGLFVGDDPGSRLGILHWISGCGLGVLALLHLLERIRGVLKSVPGGGTR